ncbi:MAG: PEP-CTERM sorting domain-containing protein [Candidatus Methylumidiphilus sp.]
MFSKPSFPKAFGLLAGAILLATVSLAAQAGLLVNPTGGTTIFAPPTDDAQATVSLGGSFNLYGTAITSINVSSNGYLTTGDGLLFSDRSIGSLAVDSGGLVIAPLYDDLIHTAQSNSLTSGLGTSNYYAVTWSNVQGVDPASTSDQSSTFQAVLFLANTFLGSYNFLAGDIAFSYGALNHLITDSQVLGSTATAGVGQDASIFTGLPTVPDGQISSLVGMPGQGFLLYRANGNGGYSVAQVPEPGTLFLTALGLAGMWVSRRHQRPA